MPKDKNKLKIYIDHCRSMKKKYQIANIQGQHNQKIQELNCDIKKAQVFLRTL